MTKRKILDHRLLYALLAASLLFFLIKGIQYAVIGSYLPAVVAINALVLLGYGWFFSAKILRTGIRLWGVMLIFWSLARLFVEVSFQLTPGITETHIREQFTILQNALTLLFLFSGVYLIRKAKTLRKS